MLRPDARLRPIENAELEQRLAEARQRSPESAAWLGLVEAALRESAHGKAWTAPRPAADRPARAPLLHRSQISIDDRAVRRWVRRVVQLAATLANGGGEGGEAAALRRVNVQRLDALLLLEAAVSQDDARVDAIAAAAGAGAEEGGAVPHALRVVAQMAALPLLQACGRALAGEVQPTWWEGYCPVCGAWPTLAEFRGLERKRSLRCGRCGTGWEVPWLRCPYCDETNHEQLGYLAPAEGGDTLKVEVCDTCKGYLKAQSTVRALEPWAVLLEDLKTLPLDVAAVERGYQRPGRPGYALEARLSAQRRRFWTIPLPLWARGS